MFSKYIHQTRYIGGIKMYTPRLKSRNKLSPSTARSIKEWRYWACLTDVSHDHHVVTLRYPKNAHNNRTLKDI